MKSDNIIMNKLKGLVLFFVIMALPSLAWGQKKTAPAPPKPAAHAAAPAHPAAHSSTPSRTTTAGHSTTGARPGTSRPGTTTRTGTTARTSTWPATCRGSPTRTSSAIARTTNEPAGIYIRDASKVFRCRKTRIFGSCSGMSRPTRCGLGWWSGPSIGRGRAWGRWLVRELIALRGLRTKRSCAPATGRNS